MSFSAFKEPAFQQPQPPDVCEINTKEYPRYSAGFNRSQKMFHIGGEPVECTIECDYKIINISGTCHRVYIIGICNQINITGDRHSIEFDGFTNEVNINSEIPGAQMCINGKQYSHYIKSTNAFCSTEGPRPQKQEFPRSLETEKRHRLIWRPV